MLKETAKHKKNLWTWALSIVYHYKTIHSTTCLSS